MADQRQSGRERDEAKKAVRQEAMDDEIAAGRLVVRQMTPQERERATRDLLPRRRHARPSEGGAPPDSYGIAPNNNRPLPQRQRAVGTWSRSSSTPFPHFGHVRPSSSGRRSTETT